MKLFDGIICLAVVAGFVAYIQFATTEVAASKALMKRVEWREGL